jgi:hypothetical protein
MGQHCNNHCYCKRSLWYYITAKTLLKWIGSNSSCYRGGGGIGRTCSRRCLQSGCWTGKNCIYIEDLPSFLSVWLVYCSIHFNMLPGTQTWAEHIDRTNCCLRIYHHNSLVSCPFLYHRIFSGTATWPASHLVSFGYWARFDVPVTCSYPNCQHVQLLKQSASVVLPNLKHL